MKMVKKCLIIRLMQNYSKARIVELSATINVINYFNISIIGPQSELLHDCIDESIVMINIGQEIELDIATTWHKSEVDFQSYLNALKDSYEKYIVEEISF